MTLDYQQVSHINIQTLINKRLIQPGHKDRKENQTLASVGAVLTAMRDSSRSKPIFHYHIMENKNDYHPVYFLSKQVNHDYLIIISQKDAAVKKLHTCHQFQLEQNII